MFACQYLGAKEQQNEEFVVEISYNRCLALFELLTFRHYALRQKTKTT